MSVIAQTLPAPAQAKVKAPVSRKERQEPAFMEDDRPLSEKELNRRPGKKCPELVAARQGLPLLPPAMAGEVLAMVEDLKRNWITVLMLAVMVLGSVGFLVRMDYQHSKQRFALQDSFQTCLAKLHAWDLDPTRLAELKIDPQRFWRTTDLSEMQRQAEACQARLEEVKQAMADSAHWPNWERAAAGQQAKPEAVRFETPTPAAAMPNFLAS